MARYILRFRGSGAKPAKDVEHVRAVANVVSESPRMLLVEAPDSTLKDLAEAMPDWSVSEEKMYDKPDPRPMPK